MIIQGTKDRYGSRRQVRGYGLPSSLPLHWVEGASHCLIAPDECPETRARYLDSAVDAMVGFIGQL